MTDWPTRYSEFTAIDIAHLRLAIVTTATLSECYPDHAVDMAEYRPAKLLAGYETWLSQRQQKRAA